MQLMFYIYIIIFGGSSWVISTDNNTNFGVVYKMPCRQRYYFNLKREKFQIFKIFKIKKRSKKLIEWH